MSIDMGRRIVHCDLNAIGRPTNNKIADFRDVREMHLGQN